MKKKQPVMKVGSARSASSLVSGYVELEHEILPTGSHVVYFKDFEPPKGRGLFFCDVATPLWEFSNSVVLSVPYEPEYERKRDVNYDDSAAPVAVNEFIVPDSEVIAYTEQKQAKFEELRKAYYNTASTLHAMSDASEYVQAALRDGIGLDLEADASVFEAFVHISRLKTITDAVNNLGLTENVKELYLTKMCELLAQESVSAMTSHDKMQRFRSTVATMHDHHARVRPQEEVESSKNNLGVRKSRRA